MAHRGVAFGDDRNRAILAFLTPKDYSDEAAVAARLMRIMRHPSPERVAAVIARMRQAPRDRDKPPSQSLDEVPDPRYGLGTHPDLISRLWHLDDGLPQRCRWVVYGQPALVHPDSGVIFGFAGGTLGYALRLPDRERAAADRLGARTVAKLPYPPPWDGWDLARAGPEWRLGLWRDEEAQWCGAAYAFFGRPAPAA